VFRSIVKLGAAFALLTTLAVNSWAEQTWTINFKDSEIQEVIKFVADVTQKTVVIDPRVKGRVKVISAKPLNEPELMHLFRTVLEIHDFSVVEVGDVLRVIPLKDTRSSPVPVVDPGSTQKGFLTQVIQLQNIAAAKVLPSIRPLVPQHSHLSAYDPSNAIIITDSAENIARIRSLIERLDQSATPITEIIELKYASAADLVQVLNNLEKSGKKNQAPQHALKLTADKRNNAVLITGEDLQRARAKKLIFRLDKPRTQTGNVRVIYLEYAKAKTVAETLTKVMANLSKLGPGGKAAAQKSAATVEADEDTNSLLITASGDELQTLLDVVTRLDIRRPQVLVEAIIAEVSDGDTRNLGIEWMYQNTDNGVFASSTAAKGGKTPITGFGTALAGASAPNLSATEQAAADAKALVDVGSALLGSVGQVLGVVAQNDNENFLGVLNALESNSKTNILSTPTLLTMDNHEASFIVGDNIPIITGSQSSTNGAFSPFQTIQRQDVGIKLTVTPQVNAGNMVLLDIAQEVSSVKETEETDQGFITSKREITTQVLAASGETIVLGGLIQEDASRTESRVPVLGRLPLIGRLFRSTDKSAGQTNLMVFLRATVVRSDKTMRDVTIDQYDYIRDRQEELRNNGFLRSPDDEMPKLPEKTEWNLQRGGSDDGADSASKAQEDSE